MKVSVKLDTLTSRGGECYEPDSLWPTPHEPLNTNPLIESLAECARADAIVHGGVHNVFTQRYDFLQNTATSMNRTE